MANSSLFCCRRYFAAIPGTNQDIPVYPAKPPRRPKICTSPKNAAQGRKYQKRQFQKANMPPFVPY